jgi:hypothetical protein
MSEAGGSSGWLQTRWITWSASTRTWRSTSRRSCPRQRGLCWQGGRCGRTRAATRALVRGVGSRRLPGTASGGGREDRQPARRPAVGSSRVHGGGSGRNLVELLRGVLLRLRAVSFSLRPLRTLSVPRLPSQGRSRGGRSLPCGADTGTARAPLRRPNVPAVMRRSPFTIAVVSPMSPPEIYALIGQPVAGNPTQEMLEAAFAAGGINARYVRSTCRRRSSPPRSLACGHSA